MKVQQSSDIILPELHVGKRNHVLFYPHFSAQPNSKTRTFHRTDHLVQIHRKTVKAAANCGMHRLVMLMRGELSDIGISN
jgi:hypothetical protein